MNKRIAAIGAGVGAAALAAASLGGISLANAQNDNSRGPGDGHHRGPHGEPVTGEAAEQATAAAQAEVPDATVQHVFARPDGGYAVGMLTTGNKRVVVLLDDSFTVEEVKDAPDRGPGHHGPRGEEATGADARKARAAARKAVKNATVEHVFARPDGGYAVGMEKKRTGKHRVVLLDEDFSVEKVFTPRGPGHGPGGHGPGQGENHRGESAGFRA